MKPPGLTWDMQVVMPTAIEDRIWDTVQEAILAGWTPQQFKTEVASAWKDALQRATGEAEEVFLAR